MPPSISSPLKEELRDNIYRIIYCLLQEDFVRDKPNLSPVDLESRKRELAVLLSRCRAPPKAPTFPGAGKGGVGGANLLNIISGLANQNDINKAFERGDTRGIVQALAQSVETIAQEAGITDQKINPEVVERFSSGADKFMKTLQSGDKGDISLAQLASQTLGDINLTDLMKGNVGGTSIVIPKDESQPAAKPAAAGEAPAKKPEAVKSVVAETPAAVKPPTTRIDDQPE
jgi:hypothetical protein